MIKVIKCGIELMGGKMSKICPKCKTKNLDASEFCKECGNKLPIIIGHRKQNGEKNQLEKYWNKQSSGSKVAIGIFCILGILLIVGIVSSASSDRNLTKFQIYNVTSDGVINIDNTSTEYVIHGLTEENATINITSQDLNITKQTIPLNANNSFDYTINIPITINEANITFEGSKPGKTNSELEVTIKRPTITPQPEQTQPTATGKYDIGGSKFDVPDIWKADDQSDPNQIYFRYLSLGLNVEKLSDQTSFDSSYKDAVKSTSSYVTTTQNDTIEGVPVKIVLSDDTRNTDNFKDYYFTKNGNFYHIGVEDYSTWKSISTQYFDDAVDMIIKTING